MSAVAQQQPDIVWTPHPGSQVIFLSCPHFEVLYDGTRGAGKTDPMLMDFAQHVGQGFGPSWRGILFRETYKQLADVVTRTKKWFYRIFPGAKFNESDYKWTFPDGEEFLLRYMRKPDDYWEYHGHEYPWIGWNELTNWQTPECYERMKSCSRSSHPGMPRKIRSDTNPWGKGHGWVKEYFVDPAPAFTPIPTEYNNIITGEIDQRFRVRIVGDILENKTLLTSDPEYMATLESITDEELKKAWRYGSWDINAGAYFSDVYHSKAHVIENWMPPPSWTCFRSMDWGSAKPFSIGWWAISDGGEAPDGNFYPRGALIRFHEWYGSKDGKPNEGVRLNAKQVAQGIKDLERDFMNNHHVKVKPGPADNQIWAVDDDKSIADNMKDVGVKWERSNKSRIQGWQQLRYLFQPENEDKPLIYIQRGCRHWIRTVPGIPRDERNWDDIDTDAEGHAADDTRYMAMFKPKELKTVLLTGT